MPQFPFSSGAWIKTRDADPEARSLFDRHYSRRRYKDGRRPKKFIGPGEYICLVTPGYTALFVWRKFISRDNQRGVNCAVFRNESSFLSSALIREAMEIAWERWPGERLYTYVDARKIRSENPGYCFKRAGWKSCGRTKDRGLHILEFNPPTDPPPASRASR